LLLHERVPRETSLLHPHELEANLRTRNGSDGRSDHARVHRANSGPPEVHLLSNGRYHVNDHQRGWRLQPVQEPCSPRWREDSTQDAWGTFFYLRDAASGAIWSPTQQRPGKPETSTKPSFSQGRAEFHSRLHDIDTRMEIARFPGERRGSPPALRSVKSMPSSAHHRSDHLCGSCFEHAAADAGAPRFQQFVHSNGNHSATERHFMFAPSALVERKLPWPRPSDAAARP